MSKQSNPAQTMVFCGVDVSAATLAVAVQQADQPFEQREFDNHATGHQALIAWLGKRAATARVSLEATGIYSMDLALALHAADGIEVAVLDPKGGPPLRPNPQAVQDRQGRRRGAGRVQPPDAVHPLARAQPQPAPTTCSEPPHRWPDRRAHPRPQPPARSPGIDGHTPLRIAQDLKRSLASLHKRILRLRREALALLRTDELLHLRFRLLTGIPGIAEVSALQLLGELALLSPEMSVRQWVAHSGLDPAHQISGTSLHKPSGSAAPATVICAACSTCRPSWPSSTTLT